MTRAVTIGYDASPQAIRALVWAADMAARESALLRVVSCYTTPGLIDPWYLAVPVDVEQIRAAVEEDVDGAVDRLRSSHPDVRVEPLIIWGKPRTELVRAASGSDLLVVGTTGAGGAGAWSIGSVALAATRTSPCPVALVPDVPVDTKRRVVVGIDGSPSAESALEWAIQEAHARRAELCIVHAWQYEYAHEGTSAAGRDLLRFDAARVLEQAVDIARELTPCKVHSELVEGSAADALVTAAANADLVVVGTRGRGSLRSLLFGSVVQAVVAHSPRPTVVVRHETEVES